MVEWTQSAETVSDGPPGMALRFVTLSPQNQELVEQLVQDHLRAGGPLLTSTIGRFPRISRPTRSRVRRRPAEPSDEGYRLTVRRTEPNLEAAALRALAEASPDLVEDVISETAGTAAVEPAEPGGFEIVSGFPVNERREAVVEDIGAETVVDDVSEEAAEEPVDEIAEEAGDQPAAEIVDEGAGDRSPTMRMNRRSSTGRSGRMIRSSPV